MTIMMKLLRTGHRRGLREPTAKFAVSIGLDGGAAADFVVEVASSCEC